MLHLRNSILSTIVYYDILDFPLTMIEVHKFLINPARLNRTDRGIGSISLGDVHQELSSLHRSGIIGSKNGFYFLSGRDGVYDVRIEREKITTAKWKKFLRLLKWFSGFKQCSSGKRL